jgi:hypothetical protein
MTEPMLYGIFIVPAIVGLTQVAKDTGLPARFAPLVAVLIGAAAGLAQLEQGKLPWIPAIALGIVFGLSACGLYDTAKNVIPNLTFTKKPAQIP